MIVKDILDHQGTKVAYTSRPSDTLEAICKKLAEYNIGLLVITEKDKIVGVLSERDVVRRAVFKKLSLENSKAKDIMTEKVVFCKPNDTLKAAIQIFTDNRFRHIPVKDDKGQLVGVITERDILEYLMTKLKK